MKKLAIFAVAAAIGATSFAQAISEDLDDEEIVLPESTAKPPKDVAVWPAFFALCELPSTPDLIGLRLTIPFSTVQENVTGFDIGLWGSARFFEGVQVNILRNIAIDQLSGIQAGIYNTAGQAYTIGIQAGLWNEAQLLNGVQAGLVNTVGAMNGVQVGLINRAESLYGFQVGAINIIRSAEMKFCPVVNIGF